jgi:putative transposase
MIKALLAAAHLIGVAVNKWRTKAVRRHPLAVEISVLKEKLEAAREQNDILRARMRRLDPRRRGHYRAHERLAILLHGERHGLSVSKLAAAFVVSVGAILGWRRDARSEKPSRVSPKTPITKFPDFISAIVRRLKKEWPRWGTRRIAGILGRAGVAISKSTVQAMLRRKPTKPVVDPRQAKFRRRLLIAKHPGHIWFLDFTRIGGFFRSRVVCAVVDAYSRKVMAIGVAAKEAPASLAVSLLRRSAAKFGAPTWTVTDHGTQFTSKAFRAERRRWKIRHRFGAVHRHGSTAIIERFWKSFKTEFAHGLMLFRSMRFVERRLRGYVSWFNEHRPHQGIGQRTPDEVHFGRDTKPRVVPTRGALAAKLIDGDRALPVIRLLDAA